MCLLTVCTVPTHSIETHEKRDELLRTISLQALGLPDNPENHAAMRIYVQKERSGRLNVVITDSDLDQGGCPASRCLRRLREPTPSVHPSRAAIDFSSHMSDDFGGAPLPAGRPRMYLGGSVRRFGSSRPWPGPRGTYMYPVSGTSSVALTASPVPSNVPSNAGSSVVTPTRSIAGSAAGTPAGPGLVRRGASLTDLREGGGEGALRGGGGGRPNLFGFAGAAEGRGVSALFDSRYSGFDDGEDSSSCGGGDVETGNAWPPRAGHFAGPGPGPLGLVPAWSGVSGSAPGDTKDDTRDGRNGVRGVHVPAPGDTEDGMRDGGGGDDDDDKGNGAEESGGGNDGDDPMRIPSDRTTPPLSPGPSTSPSQSPPSARGRLTMNRTLGLSQMGLFSRDSREEVEEAKTQGGHSATAGGGGGGGETNGEGGWDNGRDPLGIITFDQTELPRSPGGASPPPSRGLTAVRTLRHPQMGPSSRVSREQGREGGGEGKTQENDPVLPWAEYAVRSMQDARTNSWLYVPFLFDVLGISRPDLFHNPAWWAQAVAQYRAVLISEGQLQPQLGQTHVRQRGQYGEYYMPAPRQEQLLAVGSFGQALAMMTARWTARISQARLVHLGANPPPEARVTAAQVGGADEVP